MCAEKSLRTENWDTPVFRRKEASAEELSVSQEGGGDVGVPEAEWREGVVSN